MKAEAKKIEWCADAEAALRRIPLQSGYDLEFFQRSVEDGEHDLFAVQLDGVTVGYVIAWIDRQDLVLGMAAQCLPGRDRAAVFLKVFEQMAVENGCNYVRGHTLRGGMLKVAKDEGYSVAEIMYRKPVGGGDGR